MISSLPVKPLRRFFEQYYTGEISCETTFELRKLIQEIADFIAQKSIIEFHKMNEERKSKGLPELKRLDKSSITFVKSKFFNDLFDTDDEGADKW